MTVAELINKLKEYPDDLEVYVPSNIDGYDYGEAHSTFIMHLTIVDDEDGKNPQRMCLVIDDE